MLKKKRLVANGKQMAFRKPGEESGEEESGDERMAESGNKEDIGGDVALAMDGEEQAPVRVIDEPKIIIHDD
jgi:hypothetical protein